MPGRTEETSFTGIVDAAVEDGAVLCVAVVPEAFAQGPSSDPPRVIRTERTSNYTGPNDAE